MQLHFAKYHGTGNDFIMVDNRDLKINPTIGVIKHLCDRHFGIGADGVILIEEHPAVDYKMIYYNSDGSQSLCGNGSRCGFAFAKALGMVNEKATFETTDGVHQIKQVDELIHFSFPTISNEIKKFDDDEYLDTGSPHYIRYSDDVINEDVIGIGREIRHLPKFSSQNGTNVNFAQLLKGKINIRTYERGVEDETLSCGTGVTAVALAASRHGYNSPVSIETRGGELLVYFEDTDNSFENVWLAGPAEKSLKELLRYPQAYRNPF